MNAWKSLGIQSEVGRDARCFAAGIDERYGRPASGMNNGISIFDPALCEVMYRWFCPDAGKILDPFAGGSVRGIVANYLGYNYTGIEIRKEQVASNIEQAKKIIQNNQPEWIVGDSNVILDKIQDSFDFVFSCPPYADLEVYSDEPGDISNMKYPDFLAAYRSIIQKACSKLKSGSFACFVVGEIRDKHGNYVGFVPDTIDAFRDSEMEYYNEAILLNPCGTAQIRARKSMTYKKLVKTHQNVLIFKKP